ncbi:alpha/beta hydrolase [Nocardia altamirensis]|uniref:alpha/beta hydrolase n=1 Tax=Nocardia altamirensis TaxID=472158 RepID=UPI00143566AE|nr:alpha/beta hydrolase [Nocardia altamirensis]
MRWVLRPGLDAVASIARPWNIGLPSVLDYLAAVIPTPRGTRRNIVELDGYRAEWVSAATAPLPAAGGKAILYFHGGGFLAGGYRSHRRLVAQISAAAHVPVFNVAYRQLPKHSVGDSIDDAIGAYHYLLDHGFDPEDIVVAGDSAGGLLAFALAPMARRRGLPMPAGTVGLSPLLNLDYTALVGHAYDRTDSLLSAHSIRTIVEIGMAALGPIDPSWSPVNGELAGLPTALIQVGAAEVLRVDAELMAERLDLAGVPVRLQIWPGQVHVFQAGADILPEGRAAIAEISDFVRGLIDRDSTAAKKVS